MWAMQGLILVSKGLQESNFQAEATGSKSNHAWAQNCPGFTGCPHSHSANSLSPPAVSLQLPLLRLLNSVLSLRRGEGVQLFITVRALTGTFRAYQQ